MKNCLTHFQNVLPTIVLPAHSGTKQSTVSLITSKSESLSLLTYRERSNIRVNVKLNGTLV